MAFYLYDGKFLLDGGAFAISEDCCCPSGVVSGACYELIPCVSGTCSNCDPLLDGRYELVVAGETIWGGGNGTWLLDPANFASYDSYNPCRWWADGPASGPFGGEGNWSIYYSTTKWIVDSEGITFYEMTGAECDGPIGTYTAAGGGDGTCTVQSYGASGVGTITYPGSIIVNDDLSTVMYGTTLKYSDICYTLLGEAPCSGDITMGSWTEYDTCDDCLPPPCSYPTGLSGLMLQSYSDGDIPASSCTSCVASSTDAPWDGKFPEGDGPWYDYTYRGINRIDGKAWGFNSDITLIGAGGGGPCYWQMNIACENTTPQPFDIWVGTKDFGDTPLGIYTRTSGCGTGGPSSLTVIEIP